MTTQRYQIQEPLRSGGMAHIYRAWDTALQRPVAIKQLKRDLLGDPQAIAAFEAEVRTLAALRHPHIVDVFDAYLGEQQPYLVMELIEGYLLSQLLPLPAPQAVDYALQIASALAWSHANNIVHCDIKPDNIMVDHNGQIKLIDFGIAVANEQVIDDVVLGSPHYIAPERILGKPLTPAVDVYSLGIVLFQMITGVVPFDGPDTASIAQQHVTERVPLMSEVVLSAPLTLERVVAKATAPVPIARYRDGTAMHAALVESRYELAGLRPPPHGELSICSPERLWEIPTAPIPMFSERELAQ